MLHCALLVANGPLEPSSPDYEECTSASALPSDTPTALRKNWPQFFTAYYLADKVSLMSSVYTHRYDSVDHQRLGAMPLVVLSAEYSWGKSGTPEGIWYKRSYSKIWIGLHEALAHLSSRGVHRIIEGSGHTIQLEKPQAVIDAVDEVLRQLHTGATP
jgi:pimeloyl-ACP methyl ester carboxylesterase